MEKEVIIKVKTETDADLIEVERLLAAHKLLSVVWQFLHNGHREHEHKPKILEGFLIAQNQLSSALEEEGIDINYLWE